LSASIAGVVSTGPEDAADGFEADQSHRLALIPAMPWRLGPASLLRRPRWCGSATVGLGGQVWGDQLDDGWQAVGTISSTMIAWSMP
jgi:hypothetical protein